MEAFVYRTIGRDLGSIAWIIVVFSVLCLIDKVKLLVPLEKANMKVKPLMTRGVKKMCMEKVNACRGIEM